MEGWKKPKKIQPANFQNKGPSQAPRPYGYGPTQREIDLSSLQSFQDHHFLPKRDILEKLRFWSCKTSSFIGGQGLEMSIPGPLLPHKVEQGLISSLLPRPPQPQEESGPVRIGKVQKKNLPRLPLSHKNGIPAGIGRDDPAKAPADKDHSLGFSSQRLISQDCQAILQAG